MGNKTLSDSWSNAKFSPWFTGLYKVNGKENLAICQMSLEALFHAHLQLLFTTKSAKNGRHSPHSPNPHYSTQLRWIIVNYIKMPLSQSFPLNGLVTLIHVLQGLNLRGRGFDWISTSVNGDLEGACPRKPRVP